MFLIRIKHIGDYAIFVSFLYLFIVILEIFIPLPVTNFKSVIKQVYLFKTQAD
ncbi:hypothetical protein Palpr_1827 [Paludibacter propionicigenes WB4]|uniref:Uncharacterized protein n=1 Tax=Paludibacter propionicigenes (strain DSM 17365 / JCM 13257 / WB4) TaxID=694427 RepID=E4T5H2_PALPW|nr:hypothetical protein Palpr_1827 [Paludibacter propionicigenes WB4]